MTEAQFAHALADLEDAIREFRIEARKLSEEQHRQFFALMQSGINVVGGIVAGHRES